MFPGGPALRPYRHQNHLLTLRHQDVQYGTGINWTRKLFLQQASQGDSVSPYHIEAGIAYEHCIAPDFASTNWKRILELYDWLHQIKPNPMVALNRAIVVAELEGAGAGLAALDHIPDLLALENYYLLPAIRADFLPEPAKKAKPDRI